MSSLTQARTNPHFSFGLLDSNDQPIRDIGEFVTGGDLTLSTDRLGGSGTIQLSDPGIDFQSHRIQISYDPGIEGIEPWPIGVYLFAAPGRTRNGFFETVNVGLLTKLVVPEEGSTEGTSEIASSKTVVGLVEDLIRSTGETRLAVTPSSKVLTEPYVLDSTQSLLTSCNQLLDAAGYWAVSVNATGQYVLEPYQAPASRPSAWIFTEDSASVISPEQSDEKDMASVPNQFVAYTTGSDDEAPLVGVAQDNRADSPFSISARGRVIEARDQVEAVSQEDAQAIAARRLLALQSPVGKRTVSHAMLPLRPREVVEHVRADGTRGRFAIQKLSFTFDFDTQMKAEWNEVSE